VSAGESAGGWTGAQTQHGDGSQQGADGEREQREAPADGANGDRHESDARYGEREPEREL